MSEILHVLLALIFAFMFATSLVLLSKPGLWTKIIAVALLGNGINFLLVLSGFYSHNTNQQILEYFSRPAFIFGGQKEALYELSDPVSQALVLTAIVIGLGVLAILLCLYLYYYQDFTKQVSDTKSEGSN